MSDEIATDYIIKSINQNDVEKVAKLEQETFLFDAYSIDTYKEMLANDMYKQFGCFKNDGSLAGFLVVYCFENDATIIKIVVGKLDRKKGVATNLLNNFFEIVKDKIDTVLLEVSKNNLCAISFYEKFGFKEYHVRKNYYADGSDAIEMKLLLSSYCQK